MFWKSKKIIEVELIQQIGDHRTAFRIVPDKTKPLIVMITGDSFYALNISGTGVCFRSHQYPVNTIIEATVRLPSEDRIFPVTLEVIANQHGICRCQFRKIHPEAENLLHAYILGVQKDKIRKNQSRRYDQSKNTGEE